MTFAIITPALIVGAYVERIRFGAVLLFSALWLLVVYAPVAHWVWGGGWLAQLGVMDFAGGIVVHVTAGVSALVVAWMLGHRRGFPHGVNPPHAPWMVMVGAAMLWVGWFGFNAGSAVAAGADAGMAMLVTHLSAATASLVWLAIEWRALRQAEHGRPGHRHDRGPGDRHAGLRLRRADRRRSARLHRRLGLLRHGRRGEARHEGRRFARRARGPWLRRRDRHACSPPSSPCPSWAAWACMSGVASQFGVQLLGVVAVALWAAVATVVLIRADPGAGRAAGSRWTRN